jgi:hypothetical protein
MKKGLETTVRNLAHARIGRCADTGPRSVVKRVTILGANRQWATPWRCDLMAPGSYKETAGLVPGRHNDTIWSAAYSAVTAHVPFPIASTPGSWSDR